MSFVRGKPRVGELRPSQLLTTFGIGSVVDLPNISAMVMGMEDWDITYAREIGEERLRAAVRNHFGGEAMRLLTPPVAPEPSGWSDMIFGEAATIGVPVAAFPRWMVCPFCHLLAPLDSGLFHLKVDPSRPDRTRYIHQNCKRRTPPVVLPARFLVACEHGHLDDFPWVYFVHQGATECPASLRLSEFGVSGEAADVRVTCDVCGATRPMSVAFGSEAYASMPLCQGRRPHLRDYDDNGCTEQMRTILLGASNSWFPVSLSVLSVPRAVDQLGQLVESHWHVLEKAVSRQNVELLRAVGQLPRFAAYTDEEIWDAVEQGRNGDSSGQPTGPIKAPEWQVFTHPETVTPTKEFRVISADAPAGYAEVFERVVLVERLREVRALVGFTRIVSPGDFSEPGELPDGILAPLARQSVRWVPAAEVRGEGISLQFREETIERWLRGDPEVAERGREFLQAHTSWRAKRRLQPPERFFPGLRYVLLHTFAHALMRQLALDCGYSMASLSERIYSLPPDDVDGPMAGVLIYTAAPDSEGTLGGLVGLGAPKRLGNYVRAALQNARLCASDPLCAEHGPLMESDALHGAACHACLFAPETSCERGNKYLDRSVLVATVERSRIAFFGT